MLGHGFVSETKQFPLFHARRSSIFSKMIQAVSNRAYTSPERRNLIKRLADAFSRFDTPTASFGLKPAYAFDIYPCPIWDGSGKLAIVELFFYFVHRWHNRTRTDSTRT